MYIYPTEISSIIPFQKINMQSTPSYSVREDFPSDYVNRLFPIFIENTVEYMVGDNNIPQEYRDPNYPIKCLCVSDGTNTKEIKLDVEQISSYFSDSNINNLIIIEKCIQELTFTSLTLCLADHGTIDINLYYILKFILTTNFYRDANIVNVLENLQENLHDYYKEKFVSAFYHLYDKTKQKPLNVNTIDKPVRVSTITTLHTKVSKMFATNSLRKMANSPRKRTPKERSERFDHVTRFRDQVWKMRWGEATYGNCDLCNCEICNLPTSVDKTSNFSFPEWFCGLVDDYKPPLTEEHYTPVCKVCKTRLGVDSTITSIKSDGAKRSQSKGRLISP